MDILAEVGQKMTGLSRSERQIAEVLLSDLDFALDAEISELADRASVSPASVTRFCRRMGCPSFTAFKVKLAQSTLVGARYLDPQAQGAREVPDVAEDVIGSAQMALHRLHAALDHDLVTRVAQQLANARMIYAFGSGGNSALLAQEVQNRLFRLGLQVSACCDHQMQLMLAAAARPEDVVFAFSISGRNAALAEALKVASDYGVRTVAMTRPGTPVAEAAAHVIAIDLPEAPDIARPTASRFAFLAALDVVATLVAATLGASARESLRRIKHQLVAVRDPDDTDVLGD